MYKKTCQFKTWCKGDKSNIENSTDHFCEDTRQNALAVLTNLGHVTPFLLLGPLYHLTIQWETSMKRSCLVLRGNFELRPDLREILKQQQQLVRSHLWNPIEIPCQSTWSSKR